MARLETIEVRQFSVPFERPLLTASFPIPMSRETRLAEHMEMES